MDRIYKVITLGRLGHLFSNPRAYREENTPYMYKEFSTAVPSVPTGEGEMELLTAVPAVPRSLQTATEEKVFNPPIPYFTSRGTLVIPFNSPERFHWWKGGQSIAETRREVLERQRKETNVASS